jgi:peptide/nickel transport system substrate-binding protein
MGLALAVLPMVAYAAQPADLGKRVVVAIDRQPDTTDPMMSIVTPSSRLTFDNIEDTLVGVDHDGKPTPKLASWTVSPDNKILEFKIRPGVTFQNGDPLTAEDVVFSHERGMAKSASYRTYYAGINHVEAVDNLTVRFIYDKPNTGILTQRNLFVGDKAYHDKVGEADYVAHPIGTGPYKVTDYQVGRYVDLEAWSGYWGAQPAVRKARIAFVAEDATRVQMLRAGEADEAGIDVVLIGTNDLCAEMGIPGQYGDARIVDAYAKVIAACRQHKVHPGMGGVYEPKLMEKYIGMGMRFILSGSDLSFILAGGRERTGVLNGCKL